MNPKQAKKRYFKNFIPSMTGYLISTFVVALSIKKFELPVAVDVCLAIIPALFILWLIWAHARWIFETDEYERFRQIRGVLIGVGLTLAFTSIWGFLEMLVDAPKFPIFYIFVVFCVAYSFGTHFGGRFSRKGVVMHDGDIV